MPPRGRAVWLAPRRDHRSSVAVRRLGHGPARGHREYRTDRRRRNPGKGNQERPVANRRPALAVEELRRWRLARAEELLRLGIRAEDGQHVVTQADGSPLQPAEPHVRRFGFPERMGVTLHKLRHSHASHMLASNVHPKIVQERLGIRDHDHFGHLFAPDA
jgi:site-specific recombinase XerC